MTDQPDPFGLYHDRVHRDPEPVGTPPLHRFTEAARLLRALVRETSIERVEGLPWLNAQIDPELWAEVEKWSES